MNQDRHARVMMEEEYMTLVIDYTDNNDRTIICDKIAQAEHDFDVHPEVVHKREKDGGGSFTIEFSKDIYTHSRIPGEFIENVLHSLNIEHCEKL